MSYSTVNAPQDGGVAPNVNLYPGPDQGAATMHGGSPVRSLRWMGTTETMTAAPISATMAGSSRRKSGMLCRSSAVAEGTQAEAASNPGVRPKSLNDDNNGPEGLIVTIVAAVLLVAVIAAGVVMAFKLGIVGSDKKDNDPMTLAQQEVDQKNYEEPFLSWKRSWQTAMQPRSL